MGRNNCEKNRKSLELITLLVKKSQKISHILMSLKHISKREGQNAARHFCLTLSNTMDKLPSDPRAACTKNDA